MTAPTFHTLRRNLTGEAALQPGEYATIVSEHVSRTMITVVVCCPLCAARTRLDDRHMIARTDGVVAPAFKCSKCPLLERVVLDGWAEVPR